MINDDKVNKVNLELMPIEDFLSYREYALRSWTQDTLNNSLTDITEVEAVKKTQQVLDNAWCEDMNCSDCCWIYHVLNEKCEKVGIVWLKVISDDTLLLNDIEVYPSYRRQGYGTAIMQAIEGITQEKGLTQIELEAYPHNEAARRLYRKAGYQETKIIMKKTV